jgi:hypothetical protein
VNVSAQRNVKLACTIREASLGDYAAIADLQAKGGLGAKCYDDWAHLWLNNPAYLPIRDTWPIGWVLEDSSDQVVGYMGNIPLVYEFREERLSVAAGYSWVVEDKYRSYATWLQDTYFRHPADIHLNNTVSEQSTVAFSIFGSLRVPIGTWDGRIFAITSYRGFVESVLRLKKISAAKPLSFVSAPFLFLLDKLRVKRVPIDVQAKLCALNGFDQRFDAFWLELKKNFPNVLLGNRSLATLNWHFGPALARGNVWIVADTSDDRLLAYAVFVRRDKREFGLTRMRLADFQCLDGRETLLIPMLEWASARCRREGIHVLEVIGYEPGKEWLMAMLPHQQRMPAWKYYYLAKDEKLSRLLMDERAWRPYPYDGDATL